MDLETWSPLYEMILREFGYCQEEDEEAARCLATLVPSERLCRPSCLRRTIKTKVTVCAYGPQIEEKVVLIDPRTTVITAGPATTVLFENGLRPDVIVTDLDGPIEADVRCNTMGSLAVLHAHGDNLEQLWEQVPRFVGPITPTTQSVPGQGIFNFGGFTDGDRAVCLARHFGAKEVRLVGFDFDTPRLKAGQDKEVKLRKLRWARHIIYDLNPPGVELLTL